MIVLSVGRLGRVRGHATIDTPLPAQTVWGQMRDLPRFLTIDPLHARVLTPPHDPAREGWLGVPLIIQHRFCGIGPDRVGRVLWWVEGRGFGVSDLSRRGRRVGFPHICRYEVSPSASGSIITVSARGLWTAAWVPQWAVKVWLWWVLACTASHIRREMAALARWRAGRHNPACP